jgi:exodeoxyribonuclease VII large subunit
MEEKVKFLDPIQVLKRGFSITRINGKVIDEHTKLELAAEIETQTIQGSIISTIKNLSS